MVMEDVGAGEGVGDEDASSIGAHADLTGRGPADAGEGIELVAHVTDPLADVAPGGPDDHLWMQSGDSIWDLGPADLDTDADGTADSRTDSGPTGMTVYTDSDGDRRVDKITRLDRKGGFETSSLDPETGEWDATGSGRLP